MIEHRPLRRLVLTVDAEHYSSRTHDGQRAAQTGLVEVLDAADRHSTLRRPEWHQQRQGDSELAVLPPGTIESEAISDFISGLATALHHHNLSLNGDYRLRLRVAIDQGNIALGDAGFVGNAVISACRMRDSELLRRMLADHPRADFVVAVSDSIFTDVVAHGDHELYRWRFSPHDIRVKEHHARAWVCVPEPSPVTRESDSTTDGEDPAPDSRDERTSSTRVAYGRINLRHSKGANTGVVEGDLNQEFH
jgi:hypothetical protein